MSKRTASPGDLDESVHLVKWNPVWAQQAQVLARELADLLPSEARIEHIGSTAVTNMRAKPILDLMVGTPDDVAREAYARTLSCSGWEDMGEAGVPGRHYLRRRSGQLANLHIVCVTSTHWTNNIVLRDFLRAYPAERTAYAAMKDAILAQGAGRLLPYSERKAEYMAALLARATSWKSVISTGSQLDSSQEKASGS
jgi:GrpB-like predicted nucleotidyltransferase (UPF0157 family)